MLYTSQESHKVVGSGVCVHAFFKAAKWRGSPLSFSLTAAINQLYHPPPLFFSPFLPLLTISSFLSRSCAAAGNCFCPQSKLRDRKQISLTFVCKAERRCVHHLLTHHGSFIHALGVCTANIFSPTTLSLKLTSLK